MIIIIISVLLTVFSVFILRFYSCTLKSHHGITTGASYVYGSRHLVWCNLAIQMIEFKMLFKLLTFKLGCMCIINIWYVFSARCIKKLLLLVLLLLISLQILIMILIIKSFFVLTKDGKTGSETDSEKSQKEKSGELIFIRGEFVMMKFCNSSAMAPVSDSFFTAITYK